MKQLLLTIAFLGSAPAPALSQTGTAKAWDVAASDVIATATRDLHGPRAGFEDNPLHDLLGRALIAATGADVARIRPLGREARLAAGPVTAGALLALLGRDRTASVAHLSGAEILAALERTASSFVTYDYEEGRPLRSPDFGDSTVEIFEGLSYEIDLTRPPGSRVIHLSFAGESLTAERQLRVAGAGEGPLWWKDALLAHASQVKTLEGVCDQNWTVLPDYAVTPERALIDRLVRTGGAPREEVHRMFPEQIARRGDFAYWLARAYDWRETRRSSAFPDVPDSLETWLDGLIRRRVLDVTTKTSEHFLPFEPMTLPMAFEWCENAARAAGRRRATVEESRRFRLGLLAGTSIAHEPGKVTTDRLTRAQMLGMISNVRLAAPPATRRSRGR